MAEKAEAGSIPANLMRTMPYTAYVAVGSYAVIFWSSKAAWLELGLVLGEVFNAGAKLALKKLAGPKAELLRRPECAADSGIYPQHFPRASSSSGMPSGHSQTSGFLATVFTCALLGQRGDGVQWQSCSGNMEICTTPLQGKVESIVPICYIWLLAVLVMTSRTRFAGPLAVRVDGAAVAHHTVLQVLVGAALGGLLGLAAAAWHSGDAWPPWLAAAAAVLALVAAAAGLEARCRSSADSDGSDRELDSDSDKSRGAGSSEASTDVGTVGSEIELQSRSASRTTLPGYSPMRSTE